MEILRADQFHDAQPVPRQHCVSVGAAMTVKEWLVNTSLPLWAERANLPDGSWVEHLKLDGTPDLEAERRWRVLARQAVSYAHTAHLGWYPQGEDIARKTFETYWQQGWTGTHMVHRIMPDGTISDLRADLYDHAFGLLACARILQLTGEATFKDKADQILGWIETQRDPAGGWREGDVKPLPRRQNPHMHLLEASMALHEATGRSADLDIARQVVDLFDRLFLCSDVVGEFFNADWTPHPEMGDVVEPGHAVEWIWLLTTFDRLTGEDHSAACHALYKRTFRERLVTLYDEETRHGEIVRQTTRAWVMTEAVKAHLAMAERGTPGAAEMAAATLQSMMGTVLMPDGTWVDQRNACGAPIAKTIPVSTMYHIVGMAIEAERVALLTSGV
ncbi:MAG: AGE family epimerase/isomerase [Pseudomonadota bacterium]